MKKVETGTFIMIFLMLILTNCKKDNNESKSNILIFPIGRSFMNSSFIDVLKGETEYNSHFTFDSCGGFWLQIPKSEISNGEKIKVGFTRKKSNLKLFQEIAGDDKKWINPSYYIDCDNEDIINKANELIKGLSTNIEKAKVIQQFVINHVKMNIYHNSFLEKASKTYELGYGTCMNFSRLYVALCRAAKIPARTIWGIVYGYNNDKTYDYHHQWAEILDESGYWHPLDLTYTTSFDLNDIRYLDLIYAAEENTIFKDRGSYDIMLEELVYFNDYPVTLSGRLAFELKSDNRPDSMVVEYLYTY
jgi:hypothetical protein